MTDVSIVVPVYRNAATIHETYNRVSQVFRERLPTTTFEMVFVDDGSDDESWAQLERLHASESDTTCLVKLSRNFGQVSAVLAGLNAATGEAVVTLSADLQDPPSIISEMVAAWKSGAEVVIAHRVQRDDDVLSRAFSKIAYGFARSANPRMPAGGFDFVLLSRRATDLLCGLKGRHRFFQGDVLWLGLPTVEIPYARERRPHGKSGWTIGKKVKYFTDLVLDSSYMPIQVMSRLGMFFAAGGLLYAAVVVLARLLNESPFPGWAPIMVAVLVTGGLNMVMLGVIGEYLWRIYDDVRGKPMYVVERSEQTGS